MYAALDSQGQLVYAQSQSDSLGETYWCPKCQQELVLCQSAKGKLYFKHLRQCGLIDYGSKKKGESKLHNKVKHEIYTYFARRQVSCDLEYSYDAIRQVADIRLPGTPDRVLEYQLSPISSASLSHRHQSYLKAGIQDYWLIATSNFKSRRCHSWLKRMLTYHSDLGYYWLSFRPGHGELILLGHLPLVFWTRQPLSMYCFSLDKILLEPRLWLKGSAYTYTFKSPRKPYLSRNQLSQNSRNQPLMKRLYENGIIQRGLPQEILRNDIICLSFHEPAWYVLALAMDGVSNKIISLETYSLAQFLAKLVNRKILNIREFPLIMDYDDILLRTSSDLVEILGKLRQTHK